MMTSPNLANHPMPRMPMRARLVIEQVLRECKIHSEDFFGLHRDKHLVAARGLAAHRLFDIGYSVHRIAECLRRNHTTILNYFPTHQEVRRSRYSATRILRHLTPETRRIVVDYAAAENVKPELLIAQWVSERATHEAQSKLRAA